MYEKQVHFWGRLTGITAILLLLSVPAVMCSVYNIFPPATGFLNGLWMVWALYIPNSAAEVLTYTPMVGTGGAYLAFISGNLANMKVPCAAMAMDNAGTKAGTEEGEVIATISIATSTIVTELIIIGGVAALVPLKPLLETPALKPAFDNILPALFGALGIYWFMRQWKLAVVPLAFVIIVSLAVNVPAGALIPVSGLLSVLAARLMYQKAGSLLPAQQIKEEGT